MKFPHFFREKKIRFGPALGRKFKKAFIKTHVFSKELRVAFKLFSVWEKRIVLIAVVVVLVVSYFSFKNIVLRYTKSAPGFGGKLEEVVVGNPNSLNPLFISSGADQDFTSLVFSGLVSFGRDQKLEGNLAENWEISEDLKSYKIILRENLYWHDGKELTSSDVEFTFNILINPLYKGVYRGAFEGVILELEDSKSLCFILNSSQSDFLETLQFGILPKHIYEDVPIADLKDLVDKDKIIGSGPYKLDSFEIKKQKIQKVTLSSFEDYYFQRPYISKIVLRFQGESSAEDALKGTDLSSVVLHKKFKVSRNFQIIELSEPKYLALFFNTKAGFSEIKLRRAVGMLINRQELQEVSYKENAKIINSPILPGNPGYDGSISGIDYNPQKAAEIITRLGYKRQKGKWYGEKKVLSLKFVTSDTKQNQKIAGKIKEGLTQQGIEIEFLVFDEERLQKYIVRKDYDLILLGIDQSINSDPYNVWHSSQIEGSGLNLSKFENSEVDLLLERARITDNPEMKANFYSRFQKIIADEMPAIFLFQPQNFYFVDKIVKVDESCVPNKVNRFCNIENWYIKTRRVRK